MTQSLDLSTRTFFNYKEQLNGVFDDFATEFKYFEDIVPSEWRYTTLSENGLKNYRSLAKTIVSFLNRHGGRIYIGVDDETRKVIGMPAKTADYMKNGINHLIKEISPNPNWLDTRVQVQILPVLNSENFMIKVLVRRGEETMIYSAKSDGFNFYWRNDGNIEPYTLDQYRSEFVKRVKGEFVPKEILFSDWHNMYVVEPHKKSEIQSLDIMNKSPVIQKQPVNCDYVTRQAEIPKQTPPPVDNNEIGVESEDEEEKKENENEKEKQTEVETKVEEDVEPEEEKEKEEEDENLDGDLDDLVIPPLSFSKSNSISIIDERDERRKKQNLPIYEHKDLIVQTTFKFPVTLIRGRTGSGKTTQIPQYLAESELCTGKVILAQPYKESLPSIAQRIKEEYGEKPDIVSTMHDEKTARYNSKIHLMTHEALIYQLLFNADLQKYSCIIVDEAHERFIDTEILITFLRYLLSEKLIQNIKIIFASATLNVKSFKKSMNEEKIAFDYIDIPGTLYPVKEHWDICKFAPKQTRAGFAKRHHDEEEKLDGTLITETCIREHDEQQAMVEFKEGDVPEVNSSPEAAQYLIKKLIKDNYKKLLGHILVFVPRAQDTVTLVNHFRRVKEIDAIFDIMEFHGNLTVERAQKIFGEPAEGKKYKLIFSTRVGQTAITINDLFVVIDSGWDIIRRYDRKTESLLEEIALISQSQSTQRKELIGRTRQGHFFPLYSQKDFDEMEVFEVHAMEKFDMKKTILWILRMKRNAFTTKFLERCSSVERKYVENLLSRMNYGVIKQFKESKVQDLSQRVKSLNITITEDEEEFLSLMSKKLTNVEPFPKEVQKKFKKIFEESLLDIEKKNIDLTSFKWLQTVSDRFKDNLIKDTQFLMNYGLVKYIDIEAKFQNLKHCVLTELGNFACEKDMVANQIKTLYESIIYDCSDKVCRILSILDSDWKLFETRQRQLTAIKAQWGEKSEVSDFNIYLQISEEYDEQLNLSLYDWTKELSLSAEKIDELLQSSIHFSDFKGRIINELSKIMNRDDLNSKFETFKTQSSKKLRHWADSKHLNWDALDIAQTKLEYYLNMVEEMKKRLTLPENECEVRVDIRNLQNQKIAIRFITEFGQNNIEIEKGEVHGYKLKLRVGSEADLANQTLKIITQLGGSTREDDRRIEEISLTTKDLIIEHGNAIFSLKFSIRPFPDHEENYLKCFFFGFITDTAIQKQSGQNSYDILRLSYGTNADKVSNQLVLDHSTAVDIRNQLLKIIISPHTHGIPKEKGIFTSYQFSGPYASYVNEDWFYELQEPGANYRRFFEKAKQEQSDMPLKSNKPERGSEIAGGQTRANINNGNGQRPKITNSSRNEEANKPSRAGIFMRSDKK